MEAPPNITPKKVRDETFKKTTEKNENYTLNLKIKDSNSIYISIILEGDNKTYEDIKSSEEIKKQQANFEDYSIEEIYDEIFDLISKNNIEFNKNNEQILFNIILPFKKRKILYFVLENKKFDKINDSIFHQIIKQKDEAIKKYEEIIKQKDNIIKNLEEIIKNKGEKKIGEKKDDKELTNKDNMDYNKIFEDFNILKQTPKFKLTKHGNNSINTIIKLQE